LFFFLIFPKPAGVVPAGGLNMKVKVIFKKQDIGLKGENYCKKCGSLLEWGLPYEENGNKVVRLFCYYCDEIIAKVIIN